MDWMIYGANGFTGDLIAREAAARGLRPILAGRSRERIEPLARELGLPFRVFDVEWPDLSNAALVLHCAGPFSRTSKPMVDACLAARAHYLDITGEFEVFESVYARDEEAQRAGVTLIPGVGFDVVPTDCLAAMLHERMSDATELWLAFHSGRGGVSRGTLKTAIEGGARGGAIREDGKLVRVPLVYDVQTIPFGGGPRMAMTIPWGDLASAYRTTGIPNIRVYSARSPKAIQRMKWSAPLLRLTAFPPLRALLQRSAGKRPNPTPEQRAGARVQLWGRVRNARGEEATQTMSTPEGYTLTVHTALAAVDRVLREPVRAGAVTPAQRFGSRFVFEMPGVRENE